jgi:hypothetical protein
MIIYFELEAGKHSTTALLRENRWLVTNEPVEFEEEPVEIRDFRRITVYCRGVCRRNIS